MKPARSLSRAKPRPCGCLAGPGIVLHRCEEAERLWSKVQALGEAATSRTPEYQAYAEHFKRGKEQQR